MASVAATAIIALTASRLGAFSTVGRGEPFQYPWRLTHPDAVSRTSVWVLYAVHNVVTWGIIAWAQRAASGYSAVLRPFNIALCGVHLVFVALHVAQTHVFYDGLAQDVPEVTALGSVALLLIVVLVMETPRRGLILGWKTPFRARFIHACRAYHGYLFSWAVIYTFWYHPTEGTLGHLVGFFYLFLLLVQSALIFTPRHVHRGWTLALEMMVIPHALVVAVDQPANMWAMFVFGFGAVFLLTQMHGLGWSRPLRAACAGLTVLCMLAVYLVQGRLASWHEVLRIPVLDFGVVAVLYAAFLVVVKVMPTGQRQS